MIRLPRPLDPEQPIGHAFRRARQVRISRLLQRLVVGCLALTLFAPETASAAATCEAGTLELPDGGLPGTLIQLPKAWLSAMAEVSVTAGFEGKLNEVALADRIGVGTDQEQSGLWMIAPTHPGGGLTEGQIELSISGPGTACRVAWRVDARTPVPGRTQAVLTALQESLSQSIAAAGTSDLELVSTPIEQLSPSLQLLAVQQGLLGRPGRAEGLSGAIERLNETELAWLDALLADLDPTVLAALTKNSSSSESSISFQTAPRPLATVVALRPLWRPQEAGRPSRVPIEDAQELAKHMKEANEAGRRLDGAVGTVLNDIALSLASVSAVPSVYTEAIALVAAGIHFALKTAIEWDAYLKPIRFTDLHLELTKTEWLTEDDPVGTSWKKVRASAASRKWELDLKIYDTLSLVGTKGTHAGTDVLANLIDRPWSQGKPGLFSVGPFTWSNILMEDETYIRLESVGSGAAAIVRPDGPRYLEPINAGTGEARVVIRTEQFGGAGGKTWDTEEVTVGTIALEVSADAPTTLPADEEKEVCATATVTQAKNRSVQWTITGTGVALTPITDGDGVTEVCFTVPKRPRVAEWKDCEKPEESFDDSYRILVESLADKGPRSKGDPDKLRPPRQASTNFTISRTRKIPPRPEACQVLSITTYPGCLEWGTSSQLLAEGAPNLLWSADHGSIDSNGLYTAPKEGSETAIAVRSSDHPDLEDEVFVRLAERCECHVSLWVTGSESFSNLNLPHTVAVAAKRGLPWVALQGRNSRSPMLSAWLGFPMLVGRGQTSLYEEPYNYLTLSLPNREYSAREASLAGLSPGYIHIDKLGDGWFEAKVDGRLLDDDTGATVRLRMSISRALPPSRCP